MLELRPSRFGAFGCCNAISPAQLAKLQQQWQKGTLRTPSQLLHRVRVGAVRVNTTAGTGWTDRELWMPRSTSVRRKDVSVGIERVRRQKWSWRRGPKSKRASHHKQNHNI